MKRLGYLLALAAWLAAAYGVRYGLMEQAVWVGACAAAPTQWLCQVRAGLGLVIHWGLLPWASLAVALLAWCIKGRQGRQAALISVALGVPALVLYTTSLAAVAVMAAGLRWVHRPLAPDDC